MKLAGRSLINLSSKERPGELGHISYYILDNGNKHNVFFIEEKYFGSEEVCCSSGRIISEDRVLSEYDYKIDIFFKDPDRSLGWDSDFVDWE